MDGGTKAEIDKTLSKFFFPKGTLNNNTIAGIVLWLEEGYPLAVMAPSCCDISLCRAVCTYLHKT